MMSRKVIRTLCAFDDEMAARGVSTSSSLTAFVGKKRKAGAAETQDPKRRKQDGDGDAEPGVAAPSPKRVESWADDDVDLERYDPLIIPAKVSPLSHDAVKTPTRAD
jgi:hypothetical protein